MSFNKTAKWKTTLCIVEIAWWKVCNCTKTLEYIYLREK